MPSLHFSHQVSIWRSVLSMAGDAAKKILAQNAGYLRNARMLILCVNVRASR